MELSYLLMVSVVAFFMYFVGAFVLMGIVYLIGWRRYPKWKARFWWVTFGLAGVWSLSVVLIKGGTLIEIIIGFIFVILALFIWGFQRGRSKPKEV